MTEIKESTSTHNFPLPDKDYSDLFFTLEDLWNDFTPYHLERTRRNVLAGKERTNYLSIDEAIDKVIDMMTKGDSIDYHTNLTREEMSREHFDLGLSIRNFVLNNYLMQLCHHAAVEAGEKYPPREYDGCSDWLMKKVWDRLQQKKEAECGITS